MLLYGTDLGLHISFAMGWIMCPFSLNNLYYLKKKIFLCCQTRFKFCLWRGGGEGGV